MNRSIYVALHLPPKKKVNPQPKKQRSTPTGRKKSVWGYEDAEGNLRCTKALTKSEARAIMKRRLKVDRLPTSITVKFIEECK